MNTSEKLLRLRKQHGYSQEELAEKLNVSRQAISRWEANQALPDTINILQISKLYNVTTDYLLNDEYDSEDEMPLVKKTEERVTKSSMMQTSYILSLAVNVISLLIGSVGFFISKNVGIVLISFALSILSIAGFEVCLVKYVDSGKNDYRRKFYDISVWIVCFIPICTVHEFILPVLQFAFEEFFLELPQVLSFFISFLAMYLSTCFVIMTIIRNKCNK